MRKVHPGPAIGLLGQFALLAFLAAMVGLDRAGWVVGVTCGLVANGILADRLAREHAERLGPADLVTLIRVTIAAGVAALVADSFQRPAPVALLVTLATTALILDAVDGAVARRTGSGSPLGARFDMEADAFLILVLSVYVAQLVGAWVILLGLARYAFVVAGWLYPWLRRPLPPRFWRKVVAATLGVTLAVAAADLVPRPVTELALAVSLALIAESFGRDIHWLWQRREHAAERSRVRTVLAWTVSASAGLLVWFALVSPNELSHLTLGSFVQVPIEGIVIGAVLVALPRRARPPVALLVGLALASLLILKLLDMVFYAALGRPFNPVVDASYFGSAKGLLQDSIGARDASISLVAAGVLTAAIVILTPLAVLRLTRLMGRHRSGSMRAIGAVGVVWVLCAALGVQVGAGAPVASTSAVSLAYNRVNKARASLHDEHAFAKAAAVDPASATPEDKLLTSLRGKDVIVAFIESYGRVAVQDSTFSSHVDSVLDAGTDRLQTAGFSSRSAFLTSPTFGGISWLAHATLQSGLWINSQLRYNDLVASDRFTLSDAFKRAGWRTVGDVPSNDRDWQEGKSFYHYDKVYDSRNVGYAGPKFGYASMPDQYILSALQHNELAKPGHRPVMAEIDLVSSHTPWAPLPHLVDWNAIGDGSVFDAMAAQNQSLNLVARSAAQVRAGYATSIEYTLNTLISFVQNFHDDNLVVVALGDHQPATVVSGAGAGHDVPITIIAHDPAVMNAISGWGWQPGMLPHPDAPVWPMDAFRDRFLSAYGPRSIPSPPQAEAHH